MNQASKDYYRSGFLFNEETTHKLLKLCEWAASPAYDILVKAIDTMYNHATSETDEDQ